MAQHLLLTSDVEDLGRAGDIVKVRDGYARNFLIPKYAVRADKNALRMQERLKEERAKKAVQDKAESDELAKKFEDVIVTTTVKVDHEGHMYGSVAATDLVKLLDEQVKLHVEKRMIQLKHPIKELGSHVIHLKLNEGVPAQFTLQVNAEGAIEGTQQNKTANA